MIAGNTGPGVKLEMGANNNTVQYNYVGLMVTSGSLGNTDGVYVGSSSNNFILHNLIYGNSAHGINVGNATASGLYVTGNSIGVNEDGNVSANAMDGIHITGGSGIYIRENTISGNGQAGISCASAANVVVQNNAVGVSQSGQAQGNYGSGVDLASCSFVLIGGEPSEGNVISGNGGNGVSVGGGYTIDLLSNYIGLNKLGMAVGNLQNGVALSGGSNVTIGDLSQNWTRANVISANNQSGVAISTNASSYSLITNYIGTNPTGSTDMGNSQHGVHVSGSGIPLLDYYPKPIDLD